MRLSRLLLFTIALLPVTAAAQPRAVAASPAKIQQTTDLINDCERRTNSFRKTLDKALAHDNVRAGQGREDQLNNNATRLHDAMARTGDAWNKDHDYNRARNNVNAAIVFARDIDKSMKTWKMGGDAESQWAVIRNQLNALARNLGLPKIW
jgi:hypothetical protein